jgi:hypothetical protein
LSQNYIRKCAVSFSCIGQTFDAEGIRVRFKIKQSTLNQPNTAVILLTNQLRGQAKKMCDPKSEGTNVTISAGYDGNMGMIFQGDLRKAIYGRENATDTMTTILASDGGQAQSYATVSKTLPPGSTPKDIVDTSIEALKKFGVDLGFVGQKVDLSTPKYPRSIALMGMAWKLMNDVAKSKGATASIQNALVHLVTPDDAVPGGAFELNTLTGLIGMPTLETGGLYARTLINPQMKFHSLVHIDQALIQGMLPRLITDGSIDPSYASAGDLVGNSRAQSNAINIVNATADGIYRIYRIDVDADTRGEPWYQDLAMNVVGQNPTEAETFSSSKAGGT